MYSIFIIEYKYSFLIHANGLNIQCKFKHITGMLNCSKVIPRYKKHNEHEFLWDAFRC